MLSAWILLAAGACTDAGYRSGAGEPVQVRDATFIDGDLPVDDSAEGPLVINAAGKGYVVTQGEGSVKYNGLASPEAYSVAIAAKDISTGYWTVPLQGPDVTQDNDLLLKVTLDFLAEVPYGLQQLQFVALDKNGHAGPEYDSQICIIPDMSENNLAACDDAITPQNSVVSLRWDTDVDLDLIVIAPDGKVVKWDAPTTGAVVDAAVPRDVVKADTTGRLSRDSNADCAIDSINLESLIFPGVPPEGSYKFYADLNSACDQAHVNFSLTQYRRTDLDDGTHPVEVTELGSGELVAAQEDGGHAFGTFLTTVKLP